MVNLTVIPVHYLLSGTLLGLYGTQVCPFIDSLDFTELTLPILATFAGMITVRKLLDKRLSARRLRDLVKAQFKTDVVLFVSGGLVLSLFNFLAHGFPAGSGLKVVLGMSVLGFFVACDLGLRREHTLANELQASGRHIEIDQSPYPLTKKFGWFASTCVVILGALVSLVLAKDLVWLTTLDETADLTKAATLVFVEMTFILATTLTYILVIISNYGANLQFFFDSQRSTLNQVAQGKLGARVPVASNDEFGVIARHTNATIETLQQRTDELQRMQDAIIMALSSLAETRDNETGAHILRTQQYVKVLAEHLQSHPRFSAVLSDSMIDLIYKSSPLHDAGKVGIPDAVLLKPGRLNDAEYNIMKQHPNIGAQALRQAQEKLGESNFLDVACEIMETHHEKWDGTGYPNALKGEEIPVSGRLMALADVYDALISERVYKPAFSHQKARDIIVEGSGTHFDPAVVEAFLNLENDFQEIAAAFAKPQQALRLAA